MRFYILALRKSVEIPANKITYKTKGKMKYAVGIYTHNGKQYKASRIMGKKK